MTILEKKLKRAEEERRINYIGILIGILFYGSLSLYMMFKYMSK